MTGVAPPRGAVRGQVVSFAAIAAMLIASVFVFVPLLQGTLVLLFLGPRAGLDGSVALNAGVAGYLSFALARRLVLRQGTWPRPRVLVSNALLGYARGWGLGVAVLTAKDIGNVSMAGRPPPSGLVLLDIVYFAIATVIVAIPALIALGLSIALRR